MPGLRSLVLVWAVALWTISQGVAAAWAEPPRWLTHPERLMLGVGDRLTLQQGERSRWVLGEARERSLDVELLQIWLPRGWKESWVPQGEVARLHREGVTPVFVHYFLGDHASRQIFDSVQDEWYASLWRLAQVARGDRPVLVILEPEFNIAPPSGDTALIDWPGFGDHLVAAAKMLREEAPNILVGTCPGDFPGPPRLEATLGRAADSLDFIAFQEMRASTAPSVGRADYLDVGRSAVDYANYLQRAFGRPLLLGYLAISSHGGWEEKQAGVLRGIKKRRDALLGAGVFGLVYFQLFDDPKHVGYFGSAERDFGLVTRDGRPKPALEVFRELGRAPLEDPRPARQR